MISVGLIIAWWSYGISSIPRRFNVSTHKLLLSDLIQCISKLAIKFVPIYHRMEYDCRRVATIVKFEFKDRQVILVDGRYLKIKNWGEYWNGEGSVCMCVWILEKKCEECSKTKSDSIGLIVLGWYTSKTRWVTVSAEWSIFSMDSFRSRWRVFRFEILFARTKQWPTISTVEFENLSENLLVGAHWALLRQILPHNSRELPTQFPLSSLEERSTMACEPFEEQKRMI